MRSVIGATLALALVVSLALPSTALAWCQMSSSPRRPPDGACLELVEGEYPLAWRVPCTTIALSSFGSMDLTADEVRAILTTSLATWDTVRCEGGRDPGFDVTLLSELDACTEARHDTGGGNVHSVLFVPEGWFTERMHDPRAFAVTLVWHDPRSGEIWDADMEINDDVIVDDARATYGVCPDARCPDGMIDLTNVVTHELGHYFGIAHTPDDPLATMWARADSFETLKRDLRPDDVEAMCSIYPAGSLGEACDPTPRGGLDLTCTGGDQCGCRATGRSSSHGLAWLGLVLAALAIRRARARA